MPSKPRTPNRAHFWCKVLKGGVKWELYLPLNDPTLNTTNKHHVAMMRSNTDFRPLIDHYSAIEYATKYASKQEKGSMTFTQCVAKALGVDDKGKTVNQSKQDKPEDTSAHGTFTSFLASQFGGRDWSAQETSHVNAGIHSVLTSHEILDKNLHNINMVKKDLRDTKSTAKAVYDNVWQTYLKRGAAMDAMRRALEKKAAGQSQPQMQDYGVTSNKPPPLTEIQLHDELKVEVMQSSFADFHGKFKVGARGQGRKGQQGITRQLRPTVLRVQPCMPKAWGKPGNDKRPAYCERQLRCHMCFADQQHYDAFVQQFNGDFEAAYEHAVINGVAQPDGIVVESPQACRDDFHDYFTYQVVASDDEGEELPKGKEDLPEADPCHVVFQVQGEREFDSSRNKILESEFDADWWVQRTQENYTATQIREAETWQRAVSAGAQRPAPVPVDLDTLNKDQRTVFDEVMEHHERWSHRTPHSPVPQYTGMVCGTAGSGKTHLIRALKQGLGHALMVLAPTGVAADNIGGQTYHSVLPMPFKNKRVLTWDGPKKGSDRHKRMVNELENVEWIIIDEMSMIGRRSLGLIDKMLKHGTGAHDKDFGGKNMILVGDFGQLPPVGEATMYDTSSVWDPVKKKALDNDSSPFDSTGFLLYRRCFQLGGHVHFLQIIERVAEGSSPEERDLLQWFKAAQLRARDGENDEADWVKMQEVMDLGTGSLPTDPNVTYLMPTREARSVHNNEQLEIAVDKGAACRCSCCLPHTPTHTPTCMSGCRCSCCPPHTPMHVIRWIVPAKPTSCACRCTLNPNSRQEHW